MLLSQTRLRIVVFALLLGIVTAYDGQSAAETVPTQASLPTLTENTVPTLAPLMTRSSALSKHYLPKRRLHRNKSV